MDFAILGTTKSTTIMFRFFSRSSVDDLDVTVEGPSECQVTCKDSGEGMYNVEYTPSVPGDYKITITCGDNHIPGQLYIHEKQLLFSFILFT